MKIFASFLLEMIIRRVTGCVKPALTVLSDGQYWWIMVDIVALLTVIQVVTR